MTATLKTDLTVKDICEGFVYNELEGKGLFGWGGRLTIQPEYQRNYIYNDGKKDVAVVDSLAKGYPLGLIYFVKTAPLTIYICEGEESEIKQWFKTINADSNGATSTSDSTGRPTTPRRRESGQTSSWPMIPSRTNAASFVARSTWLRAGSRKARPGSSASSIGRSMRTTRPTIRARTRTCPCGSVA